MDPMGFAYSKTTVKNTSVTSKHFVAQLPSKKLPTSISLDPTLPLRKTWIFSGGENNQTEKLFGICRVHQQ